MSDDAPEGMHLCKPPTPVSGDDMVCNDCGRILVKINEDGTFFQADESNIRGGILANMQTGESHGQIIEAICQQCHPDQQFDDSLLPSPEMLGLGRGILVPVPVEIGEKLAEVLGQLVSTLQGHQNQEIDERIKPPWENGN